MIILSNEDVAALLPMKEAVEVIDRTMIDVSKGGATLPLRSVIPVGGDNRMGIMPGAIGDPACFGIKLISLFPGNPAKGLSSHRGALVLFESETGGAIAMMDASLLTAIRTAAASGVATRALARKDATSLAIIGYGEQAEHHLDAILAVRDIQQLHVAGRSAQKAAEFCRNAARKYPFLKMTSGDDIQVAVERADIVCTVTASPTPILKADWIAPGTHLNIVGSSVPSMREIDDEIVERAAIWVDYLPSTLAQAGEIIEMINAGKITQDHIKGEIGKVLTGDLAGRDNATDITLYRSLGVAAQDLASAHYIIEQAKVRGMGQQVQF
ncbi:MAG: ornithine cyclodeaminase [Hyphomicrobiales bacterium]|nr:MAG: ornithine cyclodeaminase [Hyphomicrobiales bacterium]